MLRRRMAGRSGMLGHNDVVTLQDIIELEAYLKEPGGHVGALPLRRYPGLDRAP